MRVGFIGLGRMGWPMASRLAAAGFSPTVYDADRERALEFAARYKLSPCTTVEELGRTSDVAISMLPNGDIVHAVACGDGDDAQGGLIQSLASGSVFIDMSSSAPTGTRQLGDTLLTHGIHMLDAPVSGGVRRAEDGRLAIMIGGDEELVERCRPLLSAMGERLFRAGGLASGHAMKALNNLVSAAGLLAAAEALIVGRRFDLDPAVMTDILNASTGRNNSTENKFEQFVFSRTFASGFDLDLMVKDLSTAVDLAHATETPLLFGTACRELWRAAESQLGSGADHTEVVKWLEALAGTKLTEGG